MFDNLISSDRKKKSRFWNLRTILVAIIVNELIIGGAVYVSGKQTKEGPKKEKELVTYVKVTKPPPPPPKPKKPPPPKPKKSPPPPPKSEKPPPPKGFQELKAPTVVPSKIPPVNLNAVAVNAADFSGLGVAGGRANGKGHGKGNSSGSSFNFHTIFRVVEQMPKMVGGIQALYKAIGGYPELARKAGIEGTVIVQFTVDENGKVTDPKILRTPSEILSDAVLRALKKVRFTPGKQRGRAVKVRMSIPVRFKIQ